MSKINLTKTDMRLQSARETFEAIIAGSNSGAMDYDCFSRLWHDFLVHFKGVYYALEAACAISPQNRQWFGAKKQERRNTPLLQYLWQSRDSDHHTSELVHMPQTDITVVLTTNVELGFEDGKITIKRPDGSYMPYEPKYSVVLTPVTGRGGVVFHPAKTFEGKPFNHTSPLAVGSHAMNYVIDLVEQARSRT